MGRRDRIRRDYRNRYYKRYEIQFSVKIPPVHPRYCIELDKLIKSLEVTVANEREKQIRENSRASKKSTIEKGEKLQIWKDILKKRKIEYTNTRCATHLENMKAKETARIISTEAEKYDDDVLEESNKERQKLLIIGGGVLLGALAMILILTKKKTK